MPKLVDHHARRKLIADALMRVAAEHGLEAVSLRHVATEAGVTSGMVQHYFRTKEEMMTFALEVVGENVQERLSAAGLGESPSPQALVRGLMIELLPFDERRRTESLVSLSFLAYTAVHPTTGGRAREDATRLRTFLANQIQAAQDSGQAPESDPMHTATALLALVDGLGVQVLNRHYTPETALDVLDAHLAMVLRRH